MNKNLLDRRDKGAWVSIASISANWSEKVAQDGKGDLNVLEPDFEDTVDHSGGSTVDA